jgi:hypothetical protein
LSWRLRGEKDEECRARTPDELAALPAHMRSPEICEGHLISYRLTMRIDNGPPLTRTIVPAGAKGDRPIFVMQDQGLEPGEHDVEVAFEPIRVDEEDEAGDREDEAGDEEETTAARRPLHFRSRIKVTRGQIVLITLSDDATTLVQKR